MPFAPSVYATLMPRRRGAVRSRDTSLIGHRRILNERYVAVPTGFAYTGPYEVPGLTWSWTTRLRLSRASPSVILRPKIRHDPHNQIGSRFSHQGGVGIPSVAFVPVQRRAYSTGEL